MPRGWPETGAGHALGWTAGGDRGPGAADSRFGFPAPRRGLPDSHDFETLVRLLEVRELVAGL